jgi:hypothetical protein
VSPPCRAAGVVAENSQNESVAISESAGGICLVWAIIVGLSGVQAGELAECMRPTLVELAHLPSARQIAVELNRRGIKSATGGQWSSKTVTRLRDRLTRSS